WQAHIGGLVAGGVIGFAMLHAPVPRERTRRLALDLLPPVVTRAVRRYRAAQRAKASGVGGAAGAAQSRR
ncbi:hypothetical protein AB0D60_03570, partial [Streptomyces sp. NPDC048306]